jgi:hypothetical protein
MQKYIYKYICEKHAWNSIISFQVIHVCQQNAEDTFLEYAKGLRIFVLRREIVKVRTRHERGTLGWGDSVIQLALPSLA